MRRTCDSDLLSSSNLHMSCFNKAALQVALPELRPKNVRFTKERGWWEGLNMGGVGRRGGSPETQQYTAIRGGPSPQSTAPYCCVCGDAPRHKAPYCCICGDRIAAFVARPMCKHARLQVPKAGTCLHIELLVYEAFSY